jgi:hypothetical protein
MITTHQEVAAQPLGAWTARQAPAYLVTQVMARLAAAISYELRIRRDMRQLRAWTSTCSGILASRGRTSAVPSDTAVTDAAKRIGGGWCASPLRSFRARSDSYSWCDIRPLGL